MGQRTPAPFAYRFDGKAIRAEYDGKVYLARSYNVVLRSCELTQYFQGLSERTATDPETWTPVPGYLVAHHGIGPNRTTTFRGARVVPWEESK